MNGWMDTIDLVSITSGGQDEDGFPKEPTETKTTVYCNVESARRTEYYQAMSVGVNAVYTVQMHFFEYNQEKLVDYNGNRYRVARTYFDKKREIIELTLSENE